MNKTKNLVLDLSWKWDFCSSSQELADNFVELYKTDKSIKKSVDIFFNEFNNGNEETISIKDIFDVYNSRNFYIDIKKVFLIKKFFQKYFPNSNFWISFNSEEYIWPDKDINFVKKTVLQIITSEQKDIEEINMFVYVIKHFLIEINCRINEILSIKSRECIDIYDLETIPYYKNFFEIIQKLDKSKHKFILMALLFNCEKIKSSINKWEQTLAQNIIELFETVSSNIPLKVKKVLEKNINNVFFWGWALSKRNRILITKLLIVNQDKINAEDFLKFNDKKKEKEKEKAKNKVLKQSKKWILELEQFLIKLENKLEENSKEHIALENINIDIHAFSLFLQKEIERKIWKNQINASNYFFDWNQVNPIFAEKSSLSIKISKKWKNILIVSKKEIIYYLLMFISGYKS